jgi:hypothetical protein
MMIASAAPVGVLIRDWRTHRRLSQMELALKRILATPPALSRLGDRSRGARRC